MNLENSTPLVIQCKSISKDRLDQVKYNLYQSGLYVLETKKNKEGRKYATLRNYTNYW